MSELLRLKVLPVVFSIILKFGIRYGLVFVEVPSGVGNKRSTGILFCGLSVHLQ